MRRAMPSPAILPASPDRVKVMTPPAAAADQFGSTWVSIASPPG
jgi:hypothetical protein